MNKMKNKEVNKTLVSKVYSFSKEFDDIPEWKEYRVSGKDYISWGPKNNMPEFLIAMKDSSGAHNAILQKRSLYTYGKGLIEGQSIEAFKLGEKQNLQSIIDDYWLYGMYALNVVWSEDGQSITTAEHIDMSKLRAGVKDGFGKISKWWFSNNWKEVRKSENKPIAIPSYDPRNPVGSQIFVSRGYSSGTSFYSKPGYFGSINYIALDFEISTFHLSNARNSYAPSMSIVMNSMPDSQEDMDEIYKDLKLQYQGTKNAGEVFLMFARSKEEGVDIIPINANDSDTRYKDLMGIVLDQILIGHSVVSPMLYGVKVPGSLGGSNELLTAFTITMNTEIEPVREEISETLQRVLRLDFTPEFEDSSPVQFTFSEAAMEKILTKNEMRDIIQYEPLDEAVQTIEEDTIQNEL